MIRTDIKFQRDRAFSATTTPPPGMGSPPRPDSALFSSVNPVPPDFQTPSPERTECDRLVEALETQPRILPPLLSAHAAGPELFARLSAAQGYHFARFELATLGLHAEEIARMVGPRCQVIEFAHPAIGCGTAGVGVLLVALDRPTGYIAIDNDGTRARTAAAELGASVPQLETQAIELDIFARRIDLPDAPLLLDELDERGFPRTARRVMILPGSIFSALLPEEAVALLRRLSRHSQSGDLLILGTDAKTASPDPVHLFKRPPEIIEQIARACLTRLKTEFEVDFDSSDQAWSFFARYAKSTARLEIGLTATHAQVVPLCGRDYPIWSGEDLITELVHKHSDLGIAAQAAGADYHVLQTWTDASTSATIHLLQRD